MMRRALRPESVDDFPVEAAATRMAAAGIDVRFIAGGRDHPNAGAIAVPATASGVAGMATKPFDWPEEGMPLAQPKIGLLRGKGSAYPYCGYYAHALACLGFTFTVLDSADILAGALDRCNLLVIPGGFALWGIDRCDNVEGADEAVRDFLAGGGSAIGSCGGAYYLSAGRPGWLQLASASPRYTHEYLKSGAGIVSIAMANDPLGAGTAPLVEMPYYHGPIYEAVESPTEISGRFSSLSLPARIPIDNPLDERLFETQMAGRAAILRTADINGRGVLFSAHPEMGDLVRKYVALGSYVERYLPIRGTAVMEATLDFYLPNAAPSFRVLFNAVQWCSAVPGTRLKANGQMIDARTDDVTGRLAEVAAACLAQLDPSLGILRPIIMRERERLLELANRWVGRAIPLDAGMKTVMHDAIDFLSGSTPSGTAPIQRLLDIELPLRLIEATAKRSELAHQFASQQDA